MSEIKLSWSAAEVDDGRLTVPLDGKLPRGWRTDFETTVKQLGSGEWGEVEVKRDKIRVRDIAPGSEEKLRHHLESIVAQANASHAAREQEKAEQDRQDEDDDEGRQGPDAEMTARFRAFAESESAHSGAEPGNRDSDARE